MYIVSRTGGADLGLSLLFVFWDGKLSSWSENRMFNIFAKLKWIQSRGAAYLVYSVSTPEIFEIVENVESLEFFVLLANWCIWHRTFFRLSLKIVFLQWVYFVQDLIQSWICMISVNQTNSYFRLKSSNWHQSLDKSIPPGNCIIYGSAVTTISSSFESSYLGVYRISGPAEKCDRVSFLSGPVPGGQMKFTPKTRKKILKMSWKHP